MELFIELLCRLEIIIIFAAKYNLIMEKKTYKDLKDGDIVYVVDGAESFEELTIKIREEYYPQMIENEEYDELWGLVCFFNREDAVDYYKKSIKEIVESIDNEIEKLEKRRSEYIEILNSFK